MLFSGFFRALFAGSATSETVCVLSIVFYCDSLRRMLGYGKPWLGFFLGFGRVVFGFFFEFFLSLFWKPRFFSEFFLKRVRDVRFQ